MFHTTRLIRRWSRFLGSGARTGRASAWRNMRKLRNEDIEEEAEIRSLERYYKPPGSVALRGE